MIFRDAFIEIGIIAQQVHGMNVKETKDYIAVDAATIIIDDLQEVKKLILNYNGVIIIEPIQVPTGMKMIVRHSNGNIIEYIEPILN